MGALPETVKSWLAKQDLREPIGVALSGGLDGGAVLLSLYRALLDSGQSPAQARAFLRGTDYNLYPADLEVLIVRSHLLGLTPSDVRRALPRLRA